MRLLDWGPALVLLAGVALVQGASDPGRMPLRSPLGETIPGELLGLASRDVVIPEEEQRVAGMTSYVMRFYGEPDASPAFSLYVGYYENQVQGKTIHSPKNCLPGAGWEPIGVTTATVTTADGPVVVNRYLLRRGEQRALVLYWYQGRGRIESNEYAVKLDLLMDAAMAGRSEEALVRVMVPITGTEEESLRIATGVAEAVVPAVYRALPEA
ncbi:MAG: exosortase C-terminal domain/associated protein EpsI [Longimicrobiales bacterium]